MLLNAAPSTASPDSSAHGEGSRGVPALQPPPNGLALLPVLEHLAQHELARMVAAQPPLMAHDAALAGLAWDLGLTGDDLDAAHAHVIARTP